MRRRRIEQTVELRKARKGDQLLKRRNINAMNEPTSPLQETTSPSAMDPEEIMAGMLSNNEELQLRATAGARKILSREKNPPIDIMVNCGIVPICVEFLSRFNKYKRQQ